MATRSDSTTRVVQAGLLAWLIPGAGHYFCGHRGLALVFFVAITFPFFTGVAIGGVKTQVNPKYSPWLFLAELGAGGYTVGFYGLSNVAGEIDPAQLANPQAAAKIDAAVMVREVSFFPESDIAQIYLATAGLLNLLAILDALSRAQYAGLPTFHRDLASAAPAEGAGP